MGDVRVGRRILTSGEVAKIMCVAPRTVSKWHASGMLRGWRLPGSLDRRFLAADVLAFARRAGMPEAAVLPLRRLAARAVLLAGPGLPAAAALLDALGGGWESAEACGSDPYELGVVLAGAADLGAVVTSGRGGLHLPGLAALARRLAPAAPLVVLGAGSLSAELHDDGWRCLPGDADADEVAREILTVVRED